GVSREAARAGVAPPRRACEDRRMLSERRPRVAEFVICARPSAPACTALGGSGPRVADGHPVRRAGGAGGGARWGGWRAGRVRSGRRRGGGAGRGHGEAGDGACSGMTAQTGGGIRGFSDQDLPLAAGSLTGVRLWQVDLPAAAAVLTGTPAPMDGLLAGVYGGTRPRGGNVSVFGGGPRAPAGPFGPRAPPWGGGGVLGGLGPPQAPRAPPPFPA